MDWWTPTGTCILTDAASPSLATMQRPDWIAYMCLWACAGTFTNVQWPMTQCQITCLSSCTSELPAQQLWEVACAEHACISGPTQLSGTGTPHGYSRPWPRLQRETTWPCSGGGLPSSKTWPIRSGCLIRSGDNSSAPCLENSRLLVLHSGARWIMWLELALSLLLRCSRSSQHGGGTHQLWPQPLPRQSYVSGTSGSVMVSAHPHSSPSSHDPPKQLAKFQH